MRQIEIENAKITSVSLTMADHGCITFWVTVETKDGGCCIGGYCIGHGYVGASEFDGFGKGIEAMARIMDVVEVDSWEDLKGKYCRVESEGWGGKIRKIGNILKDKWFNIDGFFKEENDNV